MCEKNFEDEIITCSTCGHELDGIDEDDCPQCDEFNIPDGTICEWCDSPAEYTVNGEPACEHHHDMAYSD